LEARGGSNEEGGRRRKWRSRTTGLGKQMKWRRFGQVEKKEEEGARNPATTIMKKVTDEDTGSTNNGHNSKGAAARPPSVHPDTTDHR